ncbi:glutamate--cysteine ligase regulatory subunit-like [Haliotis cracherodii]|uniref:glutamate--cysteine ligase regulatory subunit-like n=1 Tax=Haliotis cracherodii TaxID=6455 RepID=UPI0039E892F0
MFRLRLVILLPPDESKSSRGQYRPPLEEGNRTQTVRSMADDIPVFPKAGTLQVHSGNIVNWNRLKRKPNQTSTEELKECIEAALNKFLSTADRTELQYTNDLLCVNCELKEQLGYEEREDLKITGKLFLSIQQSPEVIRETVDKLFRELQTVTYLETLMLALPELDEEITVEQIKPYWEVMEELVEAETVLSLGICDLDKARLEELYNWAKVKPCVNQVNLASCCVMPADLTEYAKQNDIQLLTHSDETEIMPVKTLQDSIKVCATEKDSEHWEPAWTLRYSVLVKCRGIVKTKGYIFKANRIVKKKSP